MGRAGPEKTSQGIYFGAVGIYFGAVLCKLGRAPPTAPFLQPLPEWLCFCFQEELCWGTKWFCISPLTYTALRQGQSISIMYVVRPANHPASQQQTEGWLHSQGPSIISLSCLNTACTPACQGWCFRSRLTTGLLLALGRSAALIVRNIS